MKNIFEPRIDIGLLTLRVGIGIGFILLFGLKMSQGQAVFVNHQGQVLPLIVLSIGALLVTSGLMTRPVAVLMALAWAWSMYTGLKAGDGLQGFPARSLEFIIIFAVLAVTGPGKFSIDHFFLKGRQTR